MHEMFDEQKKVIEKLATKEETQKWIKTLKDTIYKDLEVYLKRLEFTEFVDRYNKE
jgi:DNA-binding protein Fis